MHAFIYGSDYNGSLLLLPKFHSLRTNRAVHWIDTMLKPDLRNLVLIKATAEYRELPIV